MVSESGYRSGYAGRSGGKGVCVCGGYNPIGLVGASMWRGTRAGVGVWESV